MKFYSFITLVSLLMGAPFYGGGTFTGDILPVHRSSPLSLLVNAYPRSDCNPPSLKIMPLGDSITYGTGVEGGYRTYLWNSFLEDNRQVDFVGSQAHGPVYIDPDHEGHPGKSIQYLRENIINWLSIYQPDIILLQIGTNDILNPQVHDFPHAAYRISALIDQITLNAPETQLLVASVTPLGDPRFNAQVVLFNAEIPTIVDRYTRRGRSVYFVDMFKALTPANLADGIHPNAAGYDAMARVWYDALTTMLEERCQVIQN